MDLRARPGHLDGGVAEPPAISACCGWSWPAHRAAPTPSGAWYIARAALANACQVPVGAPWQRLYFLPDPHGHGALRDGPPPPTTCPGAGIFAPALRADCGPVERVGSSTRPSPSAGAC